MSILSAAGGRRHPPSGENAPRPPRTATRGGRRKPSGGPEPSPFGVLANRKFLLLWLAQSSTQVGGNMVLYGLTILVYSLTGSNSANSLLILTFLVPSVVFSPIAGVFVDRVDRRLVLVTTNILRGAAFLLLVLVSDQLVLVYVLNVAVSTITTFFSPAEASMIPTLVERRQLMQANGLFTLTMNGSFALGFALFGPLVVNLAGPDALLVLVAAFYFIAAGLCFTLPPVPVEPEEGDPFRSAEAALGVMASQLTEGLRYIRSNPRIFWSLTYLAITASLIGVLGSLGPDFATKGLGLRETDFVVVVLPLGTGIVLGILVLNVYGKYLPRRRAIEGGLIALAVCLGILSVAGPVSRFLQAHSTAGPVDLGQVVSLLAIIVVLALCAGAAYAFVAIPAQTQLQEELPEDVRGRVFGILNMLVSISSFLPIIVVGPVADLFGTPAVIAGCAALVGLAGVGSIMLARPPDAAAVPAPHTAPVDTATVASSIAMRDHAERAPSGTHPSSHAGRAPTPTAGAARTAQPAARVAAASGAAPGIAPAHGPDDPASAGNTNQGPPAAGAADPVTERTIDPAAGGPGEARPGGAGDASGSDPDAPSGA